MVDLELYRVFCAVADAGSFSQAARELYITQSAVSQTVRQLEGQLSRPLFVRGRRGAALTAEGKTLYEHIAPALTMIRTGEERLERMRQLREGELTIGANDTLSEHFLLPYLERFHAGYPGVRIRVVNRTSRQAIALLRSGKLDLALTNLPLTDVDDVETTECMQVHDVFVASEKFSALRGKKMALQELAACPLVMLERLSNSRRYIDEFFLQSGVQLAPEIELGAHDLLLEFAVIGLGVACVIREFAQEHLKSGKLFELELASPAPPRAVGLCTLKGMTPSFAAERFIAGLSGGAERIK